MSMGILLYVTKQDNGEATDSHVQSYTGSATLLCKVDISERSVRLPGHAQSTYLIGRESKGASESPHKCRFPNIRTEHASMEHTGVKSGVCSAMCVRVCVCIWRWPCIPAVMAWSGCCFNTMVPLIHAIMLDFGFRLDTLDTRFYLHLAFETVD